MALDLWKKQKKRKKKEKKRGRVSGWPFAHRAAPTASEAAAFYHIYHRSVKMSLAPAAGDGPLCYYCCHLPQVRDGGERKKKKRRWRDNISGMLLRSKFKPYSIRRVKKPVAMAGKGERERERKLSDHARRRRFFIAPLAKSRRCTHTTPSARYTVARAIKCLFSSLSFFLSFPPSRCSPSSILIGSTTTTADRQVEKGKIGEDGVIVQRARCNFFFFSTSHVLS